MKKAATIALLTFFISARTVFADTISFAIGEWSPYTSAKNPKGKLAEIIVTEALKLSGHTVKFSYYPWKRSFEMVREGKAEATFPWYLNENRKNNFHVPRESILQEKEMFFHLKSVSFDWEKIEDLRKYTMGGTIGYSHVHDLEKAGVTVHAVAKEEQNFKKMLVGRIDAYAASVMVGYDLINSLFPREKAALFTNHPKPLREAPMYALFSKRTAKGKQYARALDEGLAKLKESGKLDEIIDNYLLQ